MIDKETAENIIRRARSDLIFEQPFFGYIAMKLILKDVTDEGWMPTFATDKRHLFYNRNFMKLFMNKDGAINMNYMKFIVAHEVFHCIFDLVPTDKRMEDRDRDKWNEAADYSINSMEVEYKIGKMPTTVELDNKTKRVGLYNKKYKGWYTERIYEDIKDTPATYGFDDHIDFTKTDGCPKLSSDEMKQINKQMSCDVMEASRQFHEHVPTNIKIIIDKYINPKLNWRNLLQLQIQNTQKSDYTFMKPSRKTWHMGCILPGLNNSEMIEICCAIDRSRSITIDMLKDFVHELYGIMKIFTDFKIKVWTFDVRVHEYFEYDSNNFEEILNFPFDKGGGGTLYECNWIFMQKNNIKPNQFIMFTDGDPAKGWGDPYYCDTLFIIHTNINKEAPFGLSIPYDF